MINSRDQNTDNQPEQEDDMNNPFKRSPRNTKADDPIVHLFEGMIALEETGDPANAILRQEEQGQRQFVNSDVLPTHTHDYGDVDSKAILEAAGVKFGNVVQGDEIFQYVELPQGWKKVPTIHSMWTNLIDDKGRKRASVFYKAEFYDRNAFYRVECRYRVEFDYGLVKRENIGVSTIKDGDIVLYTTEQFKAENGVELYDLSKLTDEAARRWLTEHYPKWESPSAYWD